MNQDITKQEKREGRMIKSMNQGWMMRQAGENDWIPCSVPSTNFSALLKAGLIADPFYRDNEKKLQWIEWEDWEYRLEFEVGDDEMSYDNFEFVFDGLDTYADVYLNEALVLQADNMFLDWRLACKELIQAGTNEIRIFFHSPLKRVEKQVEKYGLTFPAENDKTEKKLSVFTRKAPYHYGWDWGPKYVTSGIWRPVSLYMYDDFTIRDIQIHQRIEEAIAHFTAIVTIESSKKLSVDLTVLLGEEFLQEKDVSLMPGIRDHEIQFSIAKPNLWWPLGMGDQYLYDLSFQLLSESSFVQVNKKIGVRTFEVVREKDEHGESFYMKINGVPYFSKGANYIPSDSFLDRMTPEKYRQTFKDTVAANMNTLRVWGGGIYEDDVFYDLADEFGVVIWQDFMFACTMYPWDDDFLTNVEKEAISNIRRLRNHPCIGLWCGNNETQMGWDSWGWQKNFEYSKKQQEDLYAGYEQVFHRLLPSLVSENDPDRYYLPSSPVNNWDELKKFSSGDQHYWGVWHGEEPFKNFQKYIPRFMSEFGFQSFPIMDSVMEYTLPEDFYLDSEVMTAHQKHPRGNQLIWEYMLRDYHEPKDFESFLYMSQVLQAEGMTVAFEAHRRNMPYCMGSLYWQLNDCWPVASWSGIDYYGRWKALHYSVRKAFNDILISFEIENGVLKCYIISDRLEPINGVLHLEMISFSGQKAYEHSIKMKLTPNTSEVYFLLNVEELVSTLVRQNTVLRARFEQKDTVLSEALFYFDLPKNLELKPHDVKCDLAIEGTVATISLISKNLVKSLYLSFPGIKGNFSDNFFDLLPNEKKEVTIQLDNESMPEIESLNLLSVNNSTKYS